MDEFTLAFPGGKKVEIIYGDHRVMTDQPLENGGEDAAMSPFDLFLGSIISCSGIVALGFMRKRDISTEGLKIRMRQDYDEEANLVRKLFIDVEVPADFPEKYKNALVKALDTCTVKRHLVEVPAFEVTVA